MPAKKATRFKKRFKNLAFWKPAKRRKKSSRPPWWKTTPALAGATVCVMLAAVLIAAYQSAEPRPALPERTVPGAALSRVDPTGSAPALPAAETAPGDPSAALPKPSHVTITGCLERADETFRLKDTEGDAAPKARSWKSGFLKKGNAAVGVVDAGNHLNLSNHIGERVTVTGMLVDREIRVRSLQRVAASCSIAPRVKA
jgi:hypothetical protein